MSCKARRKGYGGGGGERSACAMPCWAHMAGARVLVNDIQEERLAYCKSIFPFIDTYTGGELPEYVRDWTGGRGLDVAVVACPAQAQAMMPELMNIGGRINFFWGASGGKGACAY